MQSTTHPTISTNLAISLDGKISTQNQTPARFTSEEDFQRLIKLRTPADVIIVGRGTLEVDSMSMRVPKEMHVNGKQPVRCIVSRTGDWDAEHVIFQNITEEDAEIWLCQIYDGKKSDEEMPSPAPLPVRHEKVKQLLFNDLTSLLSYFKAQGLMHIHCEGGGELIKSLAEIDAIDVLHITWAAHTLIGGSGAPSLSGKIGKFLPNSLLFEMTDMQVNAGNECFLTYQRTCKST